MEEVYIECQDCGERVRGPLGPSQLQDLVDHPYDYVVYCFRCTRVRKELHARLRESYPGYA